MTRYKVIAKKRSKTFQLDFSLGYNTFQKESNKGPDQSGRSAPLLFANPLRQVFLRRGPYYLFPYSHFIMTANDATGYTVSGAQW